ncbi:U8-agatoxin-Ao1a-like isoform X2 [Culicoides brevitarsis]|uniref:U8-agatoxin-Ao1a-like isoform X2 n=1 Tax=Culicoides brevitarsis TaxID=469753 RepID=UPI00307BF7F0
MELSTILSGLLILSVALVLVPGNVHANSFADPDAVNEDELGYPLSGGGANYLDDVVSPYAPEKRSCIRRNGNCDHRPNDCCYQSSCRCNLWGSNCRCQRMGLFQKWGK